MTPWREDPKSRRIDGANRIVYRLKGDSVEITQCKCHYGN